MNKLPANFTLNRYGLHIRFVQESDAAFILRLRTNEKLSRFINATSADVSQQIAWTRNYKTREAAGTDYYFIFEKNIGTPVGVCRIYDVEEGKFTTGSWLFAPEAPVGASILADIITREIAWELWPEALQYFDVKKDNTTVNKYHTTFKAEIIREDAENYFYICTRENFEYSVYLISQLINVAMDKFGRETDVVCHDCV